MHVCETVLQEKETLAGRTDAKCLQPPTGTLVDSTPAVDRTYIEFCKANGIELTRHPHVRRYLPLGRQELVADVKPFSPG